MNLRHFLIGMGIVCVLASTSLRAADSAMAALDGMVGEWRGEGWVRMGPGEPHRFRSHERVESMLGGRILTIEGRHTDLDSGDIVLHAFAVVSADGDDYRFSSYLADGREGRFRGWMEDGRFHWEMPVGETGRIVYRLDLAADRWEERGRMTLDGEQWFDTFSMSLVRVQP